MDRIKTGQLIAEARKTKNFTQKDLAEALHVSDRAVSKWERGAGFPDVSLLEPLAAALDLNVLDLLRGERTEETDPHTAVRDALAVLKAERRRTRWEFWKTVPLLLVLVLLLSAFGFLQLPVDRRETAYVYRNGEPIAVTEVRLEGKILFRPWTWTYRGRFATNLAPGSTWPGLTVGLDYWPWDGDPRSISHSLDCSQGYVRGEVDLTDYYISPLLGNFAAWTSAGDIIATTPEVYQAFVAANGGPGLRLEPFMEPDLSQYPNVQYTGGYPPKQ